MGQQILGVARSVLKSGWTKMTRQGPSSLAPYGSHVPILMALGKITQPKRILELGGGFFSTPLFLDRCHFPSVEQLTTVETDQWCWDRLRVEIGGNPRWSLQAISTSVAQWLEETEVMTQIRTYDLIFVDDSSDVMMRSNSLDRLFRVSPLCPVCLHDVQLWQLRPHVWRHPKAVIFDAFNPQTGVCNVNRKAWLDLMRRAKTEMRAYRRVAAEPKSLEDWVKIGATILEKVSAQS